MIRFTCPNCNEKFRVDDKHAGRKAKCSACEQSVVIPEKSEVEIHQDVEHTAHSTIKTNTGSNSSNAIFRGLFERIEGVVVKVENRVASMGTAGLGAGFSVPIEDLGISVGTGLTSAKSKVHHESVIWVKQADQKEMRFVFESEVFPCREENQIAIGLIGPRVLVAKNFSTNTKMIINKPESFHQINPPEFRWRFYGLLAAFFLIWLFSLGAMGARAVPYGTYKPPISRAIDVILIYFVCFSPIIAPIVIFIFVSKNSRKYFKLEYARQSKELNDIIKNF